MTYDSESEYSDGFYSEVSYPDWSEDESSESEHYYLNKTYRKKWFMTMIICLLIGVFIGRYLI